MIAGGKDLFSRRYVLRKPMHFAVIFFSISFAICTLFNDIHKNHNYKL